MNTLPATRALAAIVFTDIVGYSAVVHRDEALGARLLDHQRAVVRRLLPRYRGREVETAGDSFLLEFGSALAAVEAVIAIQQALAAEGGEPPVVLRASIHLGDVEHRGREVFGDGVNVAARLLPNSPEGGLALSATVGAAIRQRISLPLRSIGAPALKNIASPVEILVLDPADVRAVRLAEVPGADPASALRLRGPHGLLFVALAQALAALTNLFLGFGAIVLPLYAVNPRDPEAGLSMMYLGVAATVLGVAQAAACYGLVRVRGWGRSLSLGLNFLNIPFTIMLLAMLARFTLQQGDSGSLPLLFHLSGPVLSLIVVVYLLHPRIGTRFIGS